MSSQLESGTILNALAEATKDVVGRDFFVALSQQLVETFGVKCAVVTRCKDSPCTRLQTLSVWTSGSRADDFDFALIGSPCELAIQGEPTYYASGVQEEFPNADVLRLLGADSYAAIPMFGPLGSVIGHLALVDDVPMHINPVTIPALKILAARASAELQRVIVEEEVAENANRLTNLLQSTPILFASIDPNGCFVTFEGRLVEQLGIVSSDMIGLSAREVFSDQKELVNAIDQALNEGFPEPVRHTIEGRVLDSHISPVHQPSSAAAVMVCIDVSSHVQAEITLKTIAEGTSSHVGDKFFTSLAENLSRALSVPYVFIGECVDSRPRSLRTLAVWLDGKIADNYSYDLSGTPCEQVICEGAAFFANEVQRLFPDDADLVKMKAEGYFGVPLRGASGETLGQIAILSKGKLDPGIQKLAAIKVFAVRAAAELARQRADRLARESEEQSQMILDDHVDGVVAVVGNVIVYANQRFSQLVNRDISSIVNDKFDQWIDLIGEQGNALIESDGRSVPVEWESHRVRFHGADAELVVVRDLTKRLKIEEDLERLRENLAHVGRLNMMGEMTSGIAHEINQPLTAIANYTSALRAELASGRVPENIHGILNQVEDQAIRAGGIIRGLRNLARKTSPGREPTDVNQLIRELLDLLTPDARSRGVAITLDLANSLPLAVVDGIQIQQVVMNIVRNAIDELQQREGAKSIEITTRNTSSGWLQISIADNGTGLTKEVADAMFEPFNTSKPDGLGLGLSICRSIMEAHDGRIWAESSGSGGGTTVHVLLKAC